MTASIVHYWLPAAPVVKWLLHPNFGKPFPGLYSLRDDEASVREMAFMLDVEPQLLKEEVARVSGAADH
jgi:hypothetical protein